MKCPECGSTSVTPLVEDGKTTYVCRECGNEWSKK